MRLQSPSRTVAGCSATFGNPPLPSCAAGAPPPPPPLRLRLPPPPSGA